MGGNVFVGSGAEDVFPQLATLFICPGVGALVDGDHELGRSSNKGEEIGFGGFHVVIFSMSLV